MKLKAIFWVVVYLFVLISGLVLNDKVDGICGVILSIIGFLLTIYALALATVAGRTLKKFAHAIEGSGFIPDKFTAYGIYSHMRHPMHLGIMLLPLGLSFLFGNIGAILASGYALAAGFGFILLIEEPELLEKFKDEYIEYMKDTPAVVLNLKSLLSGINAIKEPKDLSQSNSKVEVKGFEAKYYDKLMNIITFGWYGKFIKKVIKDLNIQKGTKIVDFGAGTGSNALLMHQYFDSDGCYLGYEIGKEMQEQFLENTKEYENIEFKDISILENLNDEQKYDMVFISFVLHGFTQENREKIIKNAYNLLKEGGVFAILDYNKFNIDKAPAYIQLGIRWAECPLAEDFINRDLEEMLKEQGFKEFNKNLYLKGHIQLLKAIK